MTFEQYKKWTEPLRRNPAWLKGVLAVNRGCTVLGYVAYPLLLALVLAMMTPNVGFALVLIKFVMIPAVSFVLASAVRACINAPRPYEVLPIVPLIKKDTKSKSMPSRHVFSMTIIAMLWLAYLPVVGIALLVLDGLMAVVRVLGGVHWPRDVVAGAVLGVLCGLIAIFI